MPPTGTAVDRIGIDGGKAGSQDNAVLRVACQWWIVGLWAAFLVYWVIAGISTNRGFDRWALRRDTAIALALLVVIVAVELLARRFASLQALNLATIHSPWSAAAGAATVTAGATVAFAARAVIGRNWGIPATRQTGTELVTNGPYKVIRHPIYSGILLMMLGTAIGLNSTGWLVTVVVAIYFVASARSEESYMAERFPEDYPDYRARTKMLIPFLL